MRSTLLTLAAAALATTALLSSTLAAQKPPSPRQIGPFTRPVQSPVITPDKTALFNDPIARAPIHWEALHTFNPAAIVRNGKVVRPLPRRRRLRRPCTIGMPHLTPRPRHVGTDGLTFTRLKPTPVFFPAEGRPASPRVARRRRRSLASSKSADGTPNQRYVLTYTQWNRTDLLHRHSHLPRPHPLDQARPSLLRLDERQATPTSSTSPPAFVTTPQLTHKLVAAKHQGPLLDVLGRRRHPPRHLPRPHTLDTRRGQAPVPQPPSWSSPNVPGRFDSSFPEVGPPPVLTPAGIVVLYNGKNDQPPRGDPALGPNAYAAGEALFDRRRSDSKLLARVPTTPILKPDHALRERPVSTPPAPPSPKASSSSTTAGSSTTAAPTQPSVSSPQGNTNQQPHNPERSGRTPIRLCRYPFSSPPHPKKVCHPERSDWTPVFRLCLCPPSTHPKNLSS